VSGAYAYSVLSHVRRVQRAFNPFKTMAPLASVSLLAMVMTKGSAPADARPHIFLMLAGELSTEPNWHARNNLFAAHSSPRV
jgi:hypothetical protein